MKLVETLSSLCGGVFVEIIDVESEEIVTEGEVYDVLNYLTIVNRRYNKSEVVCCRIKNVLKISIVK